VFATSFHFHPSLIFPGKARSFACIIRLGWE
jgi:hypothetical protein